MLRLLTKSRSLLQYFALGIATTAITLLLTWINSSLQMSVAQAPALQVTILGTGLSPETSGGVVLTETSEGLRVTGTITNLTPGEHGFHIHEYGSCGNNGDDAGGHFNPAGVQHGHLLSNGFQYAHAGDLGNIYAGEDGTASFDQVYPGLTLSDSSYSVVGRSLVVHGDRDDFTTQPTGNAGSRVGCGVIGGS